MNLSLGIVGLPNVGKSTLFNALTKQAVPAENYPFCTIDPNVGVVAVSDPRFDGLVKAVNPEKVTPAVVEFVDIAGIVKGAHKGEGLGNAFLSNIRGVDAVIQVIRVFQDNKVTHVNNQVDPLYDKEIIEAELILKDLETIENRLAKLQKETKADKTRLKQLEEFLKIKQALESGNLANSHITPEDDKELSEMRKQLFLLTDKPFIYLINGDWLNVDSSLASELRSQLGVAENYPILPINISLEYELAGLDETEKRNLMEEVGMSFSGVEELTRIGYRHLNLLSFFTAGPEEVKAWTIRHGTKAPQAAGTIHTDFEKKFITCEVAGVEDFIKFPSWSRLREEGKAKHEGKDYVVKNGDVMLFKHGA